MEKQISPGRSVKIVIKKKKVLIYCFLKDSIIK